MTAPRGRQARLRQEFDYLYPSIQAGVWMPVESLLHQVATMLYGDPGQGRNIAGERLLRGDHFEFRGESPRPEGLPPGRTRMGDAVRGR